MILLDTHALIWVLEGTPRLGRRAARAANRALQEDRLWTSAVAFWELSLLVARGRLRLASNPAYFRTRVHGLGILEAPLTGDIALAAAALAGILEDPADCFMAATAAIHHGKLMTADRRLLDAAVVEVLDAER
ncbi:MAG TPA: PIN domain-containing protein [Vicinamibacterales bacterium]|jgi:PIN domain nuclease of toxin-antitoxin system|nr:PIN domain-containing protein [Vicinamibacterales bacterium]